MRTVSAIAFVFAVVALSFCQTPAPSPAKPKPIPIERQEVLSRLMIRYQALQIDALRIERDLAAAQQAVQSELESLRREYDAPNCELTIHKVWQCPAPAAAPLPAKPAN